MPNRMADPATVRILSLVLALKLLAIPVATAQNGERVVIDTVAIRQLASLWNNTTVVDSLACLVGERDSTEAVVIDSAYVSHFCFGPGVIGMFGFIRGEANEDAVLQAMQRVLEVRADLLVVGEVYGVIPVALADGTWVKAPAVMAAVRKP